MRWLYIISWFSNNSTIVKSWTLIVCETVSLTGSFQSQLAGVGGGGGGGWIRGGGDILENLGGPKTILNAQGEWVCKNVSKICLHVQGCTVKTFCIFNWGRCAWIFFTITEHFNPFRTVKIFMPNPHKREKIFCAHPWMHKSYFCIENNSLCSHHKFYMYC